jgi:gluconate 2-dehydrogenase gamma chain
MTDQPVARRNFMLAAGTAVAAGLAPQAQAQTAAAPGTAPPTQAAPTTAPDTYVTLTPTEAAFIVAAVDTLIPADALSPSASDCGVAVFIDRQLASAWGGGDKSYRSGPFHTGKPEQGYQLPLTPREYFAAGIAAANAWSRQAYGKEFDRLSEAERTAALKGWDYGTIHFDGFSAKGFFERLLAITMEGFFADPIYGGNRDKAGWRMIGFPGLPATYANVVDDYYGKRYDAPPQSIADFS